MRYSGSMRAGVAGAVCLAAVTASGSTGFARGTSPATARLAHSTPAWAAAARPLRAASASQPVGVRVYLAPRGGTAALNAAIRAVSTPGSASYRHFLTPAQFRARFGPTPRTIASVESWLRGAGMRVTGLGSDNRYVTAAGTAAAAERAFSVKLAMFQRGSRVVRAPVGDARVPKGLRSAVLGVTGLDTARHIRRHTGLGPPDAFVNGRPCSLFYGQVLADKQADFTTPLPKFKGSYRPYAHCGYTPLEFRTAYGTSDSGLTGKGATVAITDAFAAPTIRFDANHYATTHGDPAFTQTSFTQSMPAHPFRNIGLCGGNGWFGEETLDVEAVHAMATDAHVIYYASRSCTDTDFLESLQRIVDQNKASIVTNSWGDLDQNTTSGTVVAYEQIFKQGAMQGIGFMFSSGDDGDEFLASGRVQTDYPASDPWVTAVGGTSTAIGAGGQLLWQTGWGTSKYDLSANGNGWVPSFTPPFLYGSGGGFSTLFNRPAYQDGVVNEAPAGRAVPDVSLDGDPTTGMLVGETQRFPNGVRYGEYRIGGTSLSSPLFAGVQALAAQAAGGRLGFANPTIYALALAHPGAYRDVRHHAGANVRSDYVNGVNPKDGIVYSVRTFDQDTSLVTKKGWDDVTGIGTPSPVYPEAFAGS
jgi:subtilase family serine protease